MSRKTLNEENETFSEKTFEEEKSKSQFYADNSVVYRKSNNGNALINRMLSRSHIYSDINEANLKVVSLFDYVLLVSLKSSKLTPAEAESESSDSSETLKPYIEWQFPSEVGFWFSIVEKCICKLSNNWILI